MTINWSVGTPVHRDGAAKTLQGVPGRDLHETAGSPRDVPGPRSGPRKAFPARFFASASSCIPYALHISPFLASAVLIRLLVTSRDHVQPLSPTALPGGKTMAESARTPAVFEHLCALPSPSTFHWPGSQASNTQSITSFVYWKWVCWCGLLVTNSPCVASVQVATWRRLDGSTRGAPATPQERARAPNGSYLM